ncbi:MAG TPA: ketopantoate reductase family protein [Polyangiaceae bacterium]|jgi:2-dehydropantoate 2-reductase|nr:ketopantoate reductase family protein [Polyangiaceae bacterium]
MRIGIVGAGGVGGLIAGLLARGGHDVALVTRGKALEAIRAHGLRVDSPHGVFTAKVEAGHAEELAPVDALLLAVKTWQVPELAPTLAPLLRPAGFVVPLQNGVDAPRQCAEALGEARVVGGICHVLSWITEPGAVKHVGEGPLVTLGAWRAPLGERVDALQDALGQASVGVRVADDYPAALWQKFLFIASFGGVGAVTRTTAGVLRSLPETRRMLVGAFEEVLAVCLASGVAASPRAVEKALALTDSLPEDATASLARDVVAGRPSEIEALSGAVARIGAERGVPVPIHAAIYASVLPQERAARCR